MFDVLFCLEPVYVRFEDQSQRSKFSLGLGLKVTTYLGKPVTAPGIKSTLELETANK